MGEVIAIVLIVLAVGGAIFYVIKAKKSGKKCIGCPDGCSCNGCCGGSCSTKTANDEKQREANDDESQCCCCQKDNEK